MARVAGDQALFAGPIAELQRDFTLRFNAFIAGARIHACMHARAIMHLRACEGCPEVSSRS